MAAIGDYPLRPYQKGLALARGFEEGIASAFDILDKYLQRKAETEQEKLKMEMWMMKNADVEKMGGKEQYEIAQSLRKEFGGRKEVRDWLEIDSMYKKIVSAWNAYVANPKDVNSKLALDQAIIMGFNKMLDTNSVVRESEYARTMQDQGAWDMLSGFVQKLKEGGAGLTDENRYQVLTVATQLREGQKGIYKKAVDQIATEANLIKINPSRVIPDFTSFNEVVPLGTLEELKSKNVDIYSDKDKISVAKTKTGFVVNSIGNAMSAGMEGEPIKPDVKEGLAAKSGEAPKPRPTVVPEATAKPKPIKDMTPEELGEVGESLYGEYE